MEDDEITPDTLLTSPLYGPAQPLDPALQSNKKPSFADLAATLPALRGRVLVAVALVGVAVDQAFRQSVDSLIVSISIGLLAVVLFASGRLETRASKVLVAMAPLFAVWMTIRASSSLMAFDIVTSLGLLIVGSGLAKRGRFYDYRLTWLLQSTAGYIDDAIMAVPYGFSSVGSLTRGHDRDSLRQVAIGVVLAAPLLLGVGILLANADTEFAALFGWLETTEIVGHGFLIGLGALAAFSLLWRSAVGNNEVKLSDSKILAPITSLVIILGFVALYGLFVAIQVVDVLAKTLNASEVSGYARSGFFQLVWVALITLVVLMLVPSITSEATPGTHQKLRTASITAIGLTLVITAMSVRRLIQYIDVFGLTMLRLHSLVAAITIGLIFVLLAARLWGTRNTHDWFLGATITTVLAVVFALNIANPEAQIARYNTQSTTKIQTIDMAYLGGLSTDAIPTLVASLDSLSADEADRLTRAICRNHAPTNRRLLAYNRSASVASYPLKLNC